jgi:hypothetical protein
LLRAGFLLLQILDKRIFTQRIGISDVGRVAQVKSPLTAELYAGDCTVSTVHLHSHELGRVEEAIRLWRWAGLKPYCAARESKMALT